MQVKGMARGSALVAPSTVMTEDERAAWADGLREGLRAAAASGSRLARPGDLTAEQRRLVKRAVEANRKARLAQRAAEGAVAVRDEMVRHALEDGVGESLLARELGVHRSLVWKIHTRPAPRRRDDAVDETGGA
jgi:DNA invertase Pin-like site-specific DNA recombinase